MTVDQKALIKFWAKTTHDAENLPNAFHPLICHLIDVACVASEMWQNVLPDATKLRLAAPFGLGCEIKTCHHKNCPLAQAGKIIYFLAGLHDLGKCSPPFALRGKHKHGSDQTKRLSALYADTDCDCDEPFATPGNVPHGYVTALTLGEILSDTYEFPIPFAKQLSEIVGGHHGIFATSSDFERIACYGKKASIGDEGWDRSRRELVYRLYNLLDVDFAGVAFDAKALDKSTAMVLAGFVSVADWIGSNTDHFKCRIEDSTQPLDLDLNEYLECSIAFASQAIRYLGWNNWPKNTAVKEFDDLFDFGDGKRDLQKKAIDIAETVTGSGIFIVEALMGEGKTETAMYLADYFNAKLGTRGIFFALPTQATSDQMFGRVSSFLQNRFEESGEFVNLMLQHGHASLSDEFSENVRNFWRIRDIYSDSEKMATANSNIGAAEWFTHRRRGLLAPFGVGTVDQILFAALQTKHVFVRLFGLANKTVIIDEVHAYDAYMSTLLGRLLEWLGALGSPVVILSATLPKHRRTALIRSYLKGLGQKFGGDELPISVGETDEYPRISFAAAGMPAKQFQVARLRTADQNTRVINLDFRDDETFVEDLKSKLVGGGCAAIVCNTVRRAQMLYDQLKADSFFRGPASDDGPKLDLLHSRFRVKDRAEREKRALLRFGKEGSTVPFTDDNDKVHRPVKRPDMAVLISTQIVEQSLDIDFDVMISDLAPADLVLQRAGRLQRHQRAQRPLAFTDAKTGHPIPSLWILRPPLDEDGEIKLSDHGIPDLGDNGLIYDQHILLRSWFALRARDSISVPEEIEALIEKIYGDISLGDEVSAFESDLLATTKEEYRAEIRRQEQIAETKFINHPHWDGKLGELIRFQFEEDSEDLHPDSRAMTRLIEPTAQIACLWERDGQYYTDETYRQPVDVDKKLDRKTQKEVILNSVKVSNRSVVFKLFDLPIPDGFRQSPILRRHRYVVFDRGRKCEFAGRVFELHPEKGLLIYRKEEQ